MQSTDIDAERLQEILQGCSGCRRHKGVKGKSREWRPMFVSLVFSLVLIDQPPSAASCHSLTQHSPPPPPLLPPPRPRLTQQRCPPLLAASSIQVWARRKETGCLSDQLAGLDLGCWASLLSLLSTSHGPRSPQSCRCYHRQRGLEGCRVPPLCSLGRGSQFRWRRTL